MSHGLHPMTTAGAIAWGASATPSAMRMRIGRAASRIVVVHVIEEARARSSFRAGDIGTHRIAGRRGAFVVCGLLVEILGLAVALRGHMLDRGESRR